MRREPIVKTAGMAGTSDLTVLAPILPGLVPALDAVTYKSRARRVLRALHTGRQMAHEYDLARVLSDAVERVGHIHSVRIAVLEPQDSIMLAVTFDGPWEAYVRVIWQKVSRLLDLIFCNTVDYKSGWTSSFEEWGAWLRSRQVETPFLYAQPGVTSEDVVYLRMVERLARRDRNADLRLTEAAVPTAERIAAQLGRDGTDPTNLGTSQVLPPVEALPPVFRQGMRSLAGLYRLADLYPPGTAEGQWLLRAAHELLPEFRRMVDPAGSDRFPPGLKQARPRFAEQLDWFELGFDDPQPHRRLRPPPATQTPHAAATIQAGILHPYPDCSHGALLFLQFPDRAALAAFLGTFRPTLEGALPAPGEIVQNIALSMEGLRLAGLDDSEVLLLPEEFVQGMAARAGWLGDRQVNHPQRWRLPPLNWDHALEAQEPAQQDAVARIPHLGVVHALVQLRLLAPAGQPVPDEITGRTRLHERLAEIVKESGATPLSVQWMHRLRGSKGQTVEHFGFGDGGSDPVFQAAEAGATYPNHVHLGEVLVGYENAADAAPPRQPADTVPGLLFNGSFLVVRKLRQDLGALEAAIARSVHERGNGPALDRATLLAKMMGRWPAEHPLGNAPLANEQAAPVNDFNYAEDAGGARCPLHAHIRRANPRAPEAVVQEGARPPRLFRRSLSYGPPREAGGGGLEDERGLVFMAYNASIGEQFEVVQRWLMGGNSAGGASSTPCPFLGVAEAGRQRIFRFSNGGHVERVHLDGSDDLHAEPRPLVRLEWGAYFFTPSSEALATLARWESGQEKANRTANVPWDAARGRALIADLLEFEESERQAGRGPERARERWKAALEDPESAADYSAASIWASIRQHHGGALQTAYGCLLASDEKVQRGLQDAGQRLTVAGYLPRMGDSFGEIFLGYDAADPRYASESAACVTAIMELPPERTRQQAAARVSARLGQLVQDAIGHAQEDEQRRREFQRPPREQVDWELTLDLTELVDDLLAHFCEEWFGLSEEEDLFQRGGFAWQAEPVRYPGHFMAPSRYFFQPRPGAEAARVAREQGQKLIEAMGAFLTGPGAGTAAPVTKAILQAAGIQPPGFAARTVAGAIMGFVPTIHGSLRRVLAEWLRDATFWRLRARQSAIPPQEWQAEVASELRRGMQLRGMPETVWRTVQGTEGSADPEVVVIGVVSAAHERLERRKDGVETIFGGDRGTAPGTHPTHACPGMHAALAMMEGFLQGLLAAPLRMRAGFAPFTLLFEGREPYRGPEVEVLSPFRLAFDKAFPEGRAMEGALLPELRGRKLLRDAALVRRATIWCIGDSWLDDLPWVMPDILGELEELGYVCPPASDRYTHTGRSLRFMADGAELLRLKADLQAFRPPSPQAPRAILLGGGGNDIVQPEEQPRKTRLYGILQPGGAGAAAAEDFVDSVQLGKFVDQELGGYYRSILDVLTASLPRSVPILVHGYDHPFPDNRGAFGQGPWLAPIFEARRVPEQFRKRIMEILIDRLNAMVDGIAQSYRARNFEVHHVGFAGFLAGQPGFSHKAFWHDELHPDRPGCEAIAAEIARKLAELQVTP